MHCKNIMKKQTQMMSLRNKVADRQNVRNIAALKQQNYKGGISRFPFLNKQIANVH